MHYHSMNACLYFVYVRYVCMLVRMFACQYVVCMHALMHALSLRHEIWFGKFEFLLYFDSLDSVGLKYAVAHKCTHTCTQT